MISTRLIEEEDVKQLTRLAEKGVNDHFPYLTFDKHMVRNIFSSCTLMSSDFDCIVAEINTTIIGFLLFTITPHLYAKGKCASVVALYVSDDYRGTSAAIRLLNMMKEITKRLNTEEVHIATNSAYKIDQSKKLLERCGFNYCGTSHILTKDTNNGNVS